MKGVKYLKNIIILIICICIIASALITVFAERYEGSTEVLAHIETTVSTDNAPTTTPPTPNTDDSLIPTGVATNLFTLFIIIAFVSGVLLCVVSFIPTTKE